MTCYRGLSLFLSLIALLCGLNAFAEKTGRTPDTSESDIAMDDVEVHPSPNAGATPLPLPKKVTPKQDPADFSIVTTRIGEPKKIISRNIQLLNPPHKSTYTPGVITFAWKYAQALKKAPAVLLKIERVDGKKKYTFKTRRDKRLLDLVPGEYKWQVAEEKPTAQESRWRLFKVIGMKSDSITKLYDGDAPGAKLRSNLKTKKLTTTASIDDVVEDDDDDMQEVDDTAPVKKRLPSSVPLPPLAPPAWVKKGLSTLPPR